MTKNLGAYGYLNPAEMGRGDSGSFVPCRP